MRKLIAAVALLLTLATPALAEPVWFSIDRETGECEAFNFQGMTDPSTVMQWLLAQGASVGYDEYLDPNSHMLTGVVLHVDIHDGRGTWDLTFFSNLGTCNFVLAHYQKTGVVKTPPMN